MQTRNEIFFTLSTARFSLVAAYRIRPCADTIRVVAGMFWRGLFLGKKKRAGCLKSFCIFAAK